MSYREWIIEKGNLLFSLLGFSIGAWCVFAVIILIICAFLAAIGWALVTVVSIFTVVSISGFFAYAGIGLAVCILAALFS